MGSSGLSVKLRLGLVALAIGAAIGARTAPATAQDAAVATAWVVEPTTRARLVGGREAGPRGADRLIAAVEITLEDGWKTYWRNPGSSGVPPRFDWAGSTNLGEATVLFPAPERIADREGDTIGYKKSVVLPVEIVPKDPKLPVTLKLALEYGVCKDVCIPVQPSFELALPAATGAAPIGATVAKALARVPREAARRSANDPVVRSVKIETQGDKPHILIEATFAGDGAGADAFLEAPDGIWIPLAKSAPGEASGGIRRFHVDLTDGADIADLKGRMIRLTLVSAAGSTDTAFKFE